MDEVSGTRDQVGQAIRLILRPAWIRGGLNCVYVKVYCQRIAAIPSRQRSNKAAFYFRGTFLKLDGCLDRFVSCYPIFADMITRPLLVTLILGPVSRASPQKHMAHSGSRRSAARNERIDSA